MEKKFKTSGFTQVGTNHGSDERNNQDATASGSNERFEVIVLADGVSSCKKGGEGARITAETIKNYFLEMGESLMDMQDEERGTTISSTIKNKLREQAAQDGINMDEYASTLEPRDGELVAESFLACSDGAWKELYHRSRLKSEVKEMILGRDYTGLSEYLKSRNTFDDCTFITLDSEREVEKEEQTPLEAVRSEKAQLEDEARKISETEKAIDRVETKKDLSE